LALVVYTLGGDANAPWPFVNFLRSYCDELFVLVPFWAHSAGTLIALGADKIYMTRFATLSPIDPSVTNEFNPQDPANPGERIPVAVEDVLAFFQLASEQGADESDLAGDALPQARGLRAPSRPRQREAEHRTDLAAREEAHPAAHAGCRRGGADRPRHAIDDRAVLVSSQTISTSSI
jgi:pimeloyl-ACP methyl ester carboxylesterase